MIKYVCDICGKEIDKNAGEILVGNYLLIVDVRDSSADKEADDEYIEHNLCRSCIVLLLSQAENNINE